MKSRKFIYSIAILLAVISIQPTSPAGASDSSNWSFDGVEQGSPHLRNSHQGVYFPSRKSVTAAPTDPFGSGVVKYHAKGTIIENPNTYLIWYGSWAEDSCSEPTGTTSTASIVGDLLNNLGTSEWNKINTTYYQKFNGVKTFVQPRLGYLGCTVDANSQGTSLDAANSSGTPVGPQISHVVAHAIATGRLPMDPSGIYLVLTSPEINVSGFITTFCGYHSSFTEGAIDIKYSFVGDASNSLRNCAGQIASSPNGNPSADAMVSVIAHEIVEAASDPLGQSWFDKAGYENADKCAWHYGVVVKSAEGSFSNMRIAARNYLIQQNVAAETNICISALPND